MKEGIVMANGSVVVHDIDSLEKFGMELAARSAESWNRFIMRLR